MLKSNYTKAEFESNQDRKPVVVNLAGIPDELKAVPQWCTWYYGMREGKRVKIPLTTKFLHSKATNRILLMRRHGSSSNPTTWTSFEDALAELEIWHCDGLGFFLSADDSFNTIDLDDAINPETGDLHPWAIEVVRSAQG